MKTGKSHPNQSEIDMESRLSIAKNDEDVQGGPHDFQFYFNNIQVVGEMNFETEHKRIFSGMMSSLTKSPEKRPSNKFVTSQIKNLNNSPARKSINFFSVEGSTGDEQKEITLNKTKLILDKKPEDAPKTNLSKRINSNSDMVLKKPTITSPSRRSVNEGKFEINKSVSPAKNEKKNTKEKTNHNKCCVIY